MVVGISVMLQLVGRLDQAELESDDCGACRLARVVSRVAQP